VDDTIPEAIGLCTPGASEAQIDQALRAAMLRRDPNSFVAFTIVASGPNSALPHHETGRRVLERGDVVILDFGTRGSLAHTRNGTTHHSQLFGYQSDITVTCTVGEPTDPEVRKAYKIVWEAQQAGLAAARPGATCEQVDRAARSMIESAGYGPYFMHRTGHGLGLQGHEPPYLRTGNAQVMEAGMVFTIEPGIYLPGRFGVRLEVVAVITPTGSMLLNAPSAPQLPSCAA
jgi:Xaa-Pro aminopeptidase